LRYLLRYAFADEVTSKFRFNKSQRRIDCKLTHRIDAPFWYCTKKSHTLCANTLKLTEIGRNHMTKQNFFDDMQSKINQVLESSPAKDIEKNVKAMMSQGFAKLDLVTREEFDIQAQVLAKTRAKLEALEARVAELEAKSQQS
jgi:BMFP domain-containing protein YqiC